MDKIAVLIPCYNESATIAKVIADYRAVLPEATIYVYDNNSSDGTDKIARAAGAEVRYEHRQGKGNVIRSMFRDIEADCYLMIDGDDTYPAENARDMVGKVLDDGYDMVIGDRLSSTYFTENKRPFHNTGNVLVRKLVIETEMTIHALDKNLALISVPVDYRDRPEGSVSKLNTFSDGFKVLKTIGRLFKDYKPLPFFGICAAVLMIIALLLLWPVLNEYHQTGLVPRLPTFIAACFMALFSLQTFVCGLILDTQSKKSRQNFELQMTILQGMGSDEK